MCQCRYSSVSRLPIGQERRCSLSIHLNSSPNHAASGPRTYYPLYVEGSVRSPSLERRSNRVDASITIADLLDRNSGTPARRDRKRPAFIVLIGNKAPAVVAEVGSITGPEGKKLTESGFQERIAEAMYRVLAGHNESKIVQSGHKAEL